MFKQLRQTLTPFLDEIFEFINELKLDVTDLEIDHIALRYKSAADVDQLVGELKEEGQVIADATVNGRIIYIFKLKTPLIYKSWSIPCVELPYPATPHKYPRDGWEHIEFALPLTANADIEQAFKNKFPHLTEEVFEKYQYSLHIPKVEAKELPNPTVVLTKYVGLSVKFHPNSIEKVVAS